MVQAEDIFEFGGQGDQGVQGISNFENSKLVPTPEGLPDPRVQQALLSSLGSQHSPSERRARNEHAKALGVAAMSAPSPSSSSSASRGASRGQVAQQPNFTARIECCCGKSSLRAAEFIKAGLKTLGLTECSNPLGTDAGDAAALESIKSLAAEGHKIHLCGPLFLVGLGLLGRSSIFAS